MSGNAPRRRFAHGLVIGKFYPPHHGHTYLIRTAANHCDAVTVAVLGASVESLSIEQRVDWLRSTFADHPHVRIVGELDDAPIDYQSDAVWAMHIDAMRQAVSHADAMFAAAPPVDALFSSESYGDRLAGYFDAAHVCLDQTRELYPVSGTAVRTSPVATWSNLPAATRAGLCLRVVVVGAESTGTTTLARDLAEALRERGDIWQRTEWVAEYGREYSANLLALTRAANRHARAEDIVWHGDDFVTVAREQCRREDAAAALGSPVLICDTDAWATRLWHERYMGGEHPQVAQIAAAMPPRALYLLTSDDGVPFVDDGLRDGEHIRHWMHERFIAQLQAQKVPWQMMVGSRADRLSAALRAIDELIARSWQFELPLEQRA